MNSRGISDEARPDASRHAGADHLYVLGLKPGWGQSGSKGSAADHDRQSGMAHHMFGNAAHQQSRQSSSAMGADHNEVESAFVSQVHNLSARFTNGMRQAALDSAAVQLGL